MARRIANSIYSCDPSYDVWKLPIQHAATETACHRSEVGHPFDCLMRCFNQSWDLVLHVAWGIHHPKNINLYRLIGASNWVWVPHNDTARNLMSCHLTSGDLTSQFSSNLRTVYIIQWIVFCASLWILLLQNTSRIKIKLQGRALELEPHHSVPSKTLGWLPWLSCVWGLPMNVAADEAPGILHE